MLEELAVKTPSKPCSVPAWEDEQGQKVFNLLLVELDILWTVWHHGQGGQTQAERHWPTHITTWV